MMKTDQHQRRYLKDYRPPEFRVERVDLDFRLHPERTRVTSRLAIRRAGGEPGRPLVLDGVGLELLELEIDGEPVATSRYARDGETLTIADPPDRFELRSVVEIDPASNTRLEGLYLSNGNFCTQCEAEGFRHITYCIDRPDNMAVFTTRIEAPRGDYPVLLSNGNRTEQGVDGDRHWVRWHDPFPKPSYLFALVAGDLACIEESFTTRSGRDVSLHIYTEQHNRDKCGHALESLRKAMRWDEEVYGLEYDLDLYMIVAVDDFNMGAMENKGLNVFNTRYVLANPEIATDDDYLAIEGVIAHEYFHNWTGNRVTCRDWFQLSLKEGLTVFRDQEFSADMFSRAIQRINDVRALRNHQFTEDAGPMAHPVRPAAYQEVNNFYTATVYNKGAEVVRMIHCLLGAEKFRAGMDLYFARHDGQAVTTDDFRRAMQDASGIDLERFQRWYEQAGTPRLDLRREYDPATRRLTLRVTQRPGTTRGELNRPFQVPLRLALFDAAGGPLPLDADGTLERVESIDAHETELIFDDMPAGVLPSALRGFSAPVILTSDLEEAELARLMVCDSDPFNCWEAGQQLACRVMLAMLERDADGWPELQAELIAACRGLLGDDSGDRALIAEMLTLPGEKYLAEMLERVDVAQVHAVREALQDAIARAAETALLEHYTACSAADGYRFDATEVAKRRLRNTCLRYLLRLGHSRYFTLCREQFDGADNMTDQLACLEAIVHYDHPLRDAIVTRFYAQWQDTGLVVDKWFAAQASSLRADALDAIVPLFEHPAYRLQNPNRARSLLLPLMQNPRAFHRPDGAGYRFAAGKILALDAINPQVAARLANPFLHWRKLVPELGEAMRSEVESMLARGDLSGDLHELLSASLAD